MSITLYAGRMPTLLSLVPSPVTRPPSPPRTAPPVPCHRARGAPPSPRRGPTSNSRRWSEAEPTVSAASSPRPGGAPHPRPPFPIPHHLFPAFRTFRAPSPPSPAIPPHLCTITLEQREQPSGAQPQWLFDKRIDNAPGRPPPPPPRSAPRPPSPVPAAQRPPVPRHPSPPRSGHPSPVTRPPYPRAQRAHFLLAIGGGIQSAHPPQVESCRSSVGRARPW